MKLLGERLRSRLFWILDDLKGGRVKAHLQDITDILENFNSAKSGQRRDLLLKQVLQHALDTTPYYKNYNSSSTLQTFPVVNKTIIQKNYHEFQSFKFKDSPKTQMSTSGSSGSPFKVYWNEDKVYRNRADTIYLQGLAGYKVGYRLYYIRKWLSKYKASKLTTAMRNIKMVNVSDFSNDYLANFIKNLQADTSSKVLLSYSSALRDICQYLDNINAAPVATEVSSIIAMAEALTDHTRERLQFYFKAPVFSRYSNQENGILSLQLSQKNKNFQINWASYYIEILDMKKDVPVALGTLGRVVVTDLFNYEMPFIRYDTGDLAIMTDEGAYFEGTSVFSRVEGRKMDVLQDTSGNVVSGYNVHHLESYPEIKQFQFIQEGRTQYRINLVVDQKLKNESQVVEHFKNFLGMDADIQISYFNKIPQLASGKRRLIINTYKKENI